MEILIFLFGLIIGSFLNVCIYRLPFDQSILQPRSYCIKCQTTLQPIDLIPVLSWLSLRGKCRYCNTKITLRYAIVELFTAILFLYMYLQLGLGIRLLQAIFFISFLIVIALIDYDHQLILDNVLLCACGVGILINILIANTNSIIINWSSLILGALVGFGILFLIILLSCGRMGEGDALFAGVLGIWFGWKYILITLYISFLFGGILSLFLLLLGKKVKDSVPFGSIMAICAFIVYTYVKLP